MTPRACLFVVLSVMVIAAGDRDPVVADDDPVARIEPLIGLLTEVEDDGVRRDVLKGMYDAVKGRRRLGVPEGWPKLYASLKTSRDASVRETALLLALVFGDESAMASLRERVRDTEVATTERSKAVDSLVSVGDPKLQPLLPALLDERSMRGAALRALSAYDSEAIPTAILKRYADFDAEARRDAVATLASRKPWAGQLLAAIEAKRVPSRDVSAFTARQLSGFGDAELTAKLEAVWGRVRPTPGEKAKRIAALKRELTPGLLADSSASRGRVVFRKTCAGCHKLFGEGRAVGPELTGSQRANVDYVLQNLVAPNAIVGRDFRVTTIVTQSGRVLNGIVAEENDNAIVLRTANDDVTIPLDEIDVRKASRVSMMPEGMLDKLTTTELRDLVRYLQSPRQVPEAE